MDDLFRQRSLRQLKIDREAISSSSICTVILHLRKQHHTRAASVISARVPTAETPPTRVGRVIAARRLMSHCAEGGSARCHSMTPELRRGAW